MCLKASLYPSESKSFGVSGHSTLLNPLPAAEEQLSHADSRSDGVTGLEHPSHLVTSMALPAKRTLNYSNRVSLKLIHRNIKNKLCYMLDQKPKKLTLTHLFVYYYFMITSETFFQQQIYLILGISNIFLNYFSICFAEL